MTHDPLGLNATSAFSLVRNQGNIAAGIIWEADAELIKACVEGPFRKFMTAIGQRIADNATPQALP